MVRTAQLHARWPDDGTEPVGVADTERVKLAPLRARAKCQVCDSKLPPRTEAYYDEETRAAVCLTCARLTGLEASVAAEAAVGEQVQAPPAPAPVPAIEPESEREPQAAQPEAAAAAPTPEDDTTPVVAAAADDVAVDLPEPLPFVDPDARRPRVVRPPLLAARGAKEPVARQAVEPIEEPRPSMFAEREPRPPLAPQVDGRPPLPPRAPIAPVLPPRTPVATPVEDQPGSDVESSSTEVDAPAPAPAPAADPEPGPQGPVGDAALDGGEPDVDDDPQWAESGGGPPLSFEDTGDHSRHVRASAGLISRLRTVDRDHEIDPGMLVDGDVMVEDLPVGHGLERGDPGDGRVGRLLEGARVHGIEVLHHLPVAKGEVVDHLVVAVNGLWVIRAEATLDGPLERRDLGDWFTADARLFVGDDDRSDLITDARNRAGTLRRSLASTAFADIPVRPVVCFGSAPAGWVVEPFTLAGVAVTWGSGLIEPLLHPVLVDKVTRARLMQMLIDAASLY